jgi:hypothetical protein
MSIISLANDLRNHGLPIALKVAAWSLVLIVGGYGLVVAPELQLSVAKDAGAPSPAATPHTGRDVPSHVAATLNRSTSRIDDNDERSDFARE